MLRFVMLTLSGLTSKFKVVERLNVYKTLSETTASLCHGDEETGTLRAYWNPTGYMRILRNGIGCAPALPQELLSVCEKAVDRIDPAIRSKAFVTVLLRKKGQAGHELIDRVRCAGVHHNYRPAVEFLVERGIRVILVGETEIEQFKDLRLVYACSEFGSPQKLLNIYFLMKCMLFIGQHSGPLYLVNSCGIPVLVCDGMPYWQGTMRQSDMILHKRFKLNGSLLSLSDVFFRLPHLAYLYDVHASGAQVQDNHADEISAAVMEMYESVFEQKMVDAQVAEKLEEFYDRLPDSILLKYTRNRLPRFVVDALNI
jgi:putative glycosyltransferase (TIGR04372 family)